MTESTKEFDYIKIKLASPFRILQWTNRKLPNGQFVGEVQKSETINYRTFKPEMDGLFCERIFGPSKSFECACGKYKQVRYEGLICERCGVELTESSVRRHRMGYVNLIYPVTHVWYINSRPNYMALLLEVEECQKKIDLVYPKLLSEIEECKEKIIKKKIKKCEENLDLTELEIDACKKPLDIKEISSKTVDLWDQRIKRIKLASLAYFIAEDEISFYGLHWDLQQYRRCRESVGYLESIDCGLHWHLENYRKSLELGYTGYPLKPASKPLTRRYNIPKYLLRATPSFLIGAPIIKRELERLDLKRESSETRIFILACTKVLNKEKPFYNGFEWFKTWQQQRIYKIREQSIKRLRILENLIGTGSSPAWMILTILPVIPPALRPMIQLEGGRFATSDLNELYRRIIVRNNRLLRLLEIDAPPLIIHNEKRLLQEAVDTLIDNGKRGKIALSANNRPLKSLSDIIKGKRGRFRQNLLGKRVDYSGRSVIVVGPSLKLNQCGLPYEMAIELFHSFIVYELINQGLATNMRMAKSLIQKNEPRLASVLEKILKNHPIFLNRAPTLHRLGIQAFEPILVQGRAIKLHPLVCSAFNADFDGDQMAVHIPLSLQAQAECYMLMLAPYNFLSPANGEPIIMPSQDMVLGCYYLTANNINNLLGANHYFVDLNDVILAYTQNKIEIHSTIWIRINEETSVLTCLLKTIKLKDETLIEFYEDKQVRKTNKGEIIVQYLKTTTGRAILNSVVQKTLKLL